MYENPYALTNNFKLNRLTKHSYTHNQEIKSRTEHIVSTFKVGLRLHISTERNIKIKTSLIRNNNYL